MNGKPVHDEVSSIRVYGNPSRQVPFQLQRIDGPDDYRAWAFVIDYSLPFADYALVVRDGEGRILPRQIVDSLAPLSSAERRSIEFDRSSHPIGWRHLLDPARGKPKWDLQEARRELDKVRQSISVFGLQAGAEAFHSGVGVLLALLAFTLLGPLRALGTARVAEPVATSWLPAMPLAAGAPQERMVHTAYVGLSLLPGVLVSLIAVWPCPQRVGGYVLSLAGVLGGWFASALMLRTCGALRRVRHATA